MAKKGKKSKKPEYPQGDMVKGKIISIATKPSKLTNKKTGKKVKYYPTTVLVKAHGLKFKTFAILWAGAFNMDPDTYVKGSKVPVEMLDTGKPTMLAKIGPASAEGMDPAIYEKARKASKKKKV